MKRIIITILAAFFLTALLAGCAKTPLSPPEIRVIHSERTDLKYALTLPEGYAEKPDVKRPLILYLHPSGGNSIEDLQGITVVYNKIEDFPFVTVSPLAPVDMNWNAITDLLDILIDEAIAEYNIDPDRVYMTGWSMGGFGTWETAMQYPEKFAAIIPVCGGGDPYMIENIKEIPVWNFHGEFDDSVPIQASHEMVDALKAVGGNVKFVPDPNAGHRMEVTYNNPEIYKWLLKQKRSGKAAAVVRRTPEVPEVVEVPATKVAYYRAYGDDSEEAALAKMREFAKLNLTAEDTRYFGFGIDNGMSGRGYEVRIPVSADVSGTDEVSIRDFPGGLYAVMSAEGDAYTDVLKWQRTSEYKTIQDGGMAEYIYSNDGEIADVRIYIPIIPNITNITGD